MTEGLDFHTVFVVIGYVMLIGMAALHRYRLNRALSALPDETRERLGLILPAGRSSRRHRRLVARRLLLRGLPDWLPLGAEGRRDLFWYRAFGFASAAWLIGALPAAWGVWILIPILGLPVLVGFAIYALIDGPWGGPGGGPGAGPGEGE